ncbi:MAG: ATP-binding cassette domain-containing protein [Sulfurospirillaceae bacterium]|nr:ATP-binding cassette domain-containing protein [Sulfurospirillaceae bacterium]MDD2827660.1 ATP-binding cassette domain-containing protein [Sulfurospirillaceae bacterium]
MSLTCKQLLVKSKGKTLLNIDFSFADSFALIGESGSGKSLTLKALLGMLPQELEVLMHVETSYVLERGQSIAMVPQNPFTALSPLTTIADQFMQNTTISEAYLKKVELGAEVLARFPSELSGGQLQRVIIAMALSLEPKLLLLDEPTTALDEESKKTILSLIKQLQKSFGFDILFVTHDIETIEGLCEDVAILKDGLIIERGNTKEILYHPKENYTKELLGSGFKQRRFRA